MGKKISPWPKLYFRRLRRMATPSTVRGSLPVLFFGDIRKASFCTLALNPSDKEFLDRAGMMLDGGKRRFESLGSLGARSRSQLTRAQCLKALDTMTHYFEEGKPVYEWFRPLEHVLNGLGVSYKKGEAVHLDLVQEATNPKWADLEKTRPNELDKLREADLLFLRAQIERLAPRLILCNGASPRRYLEGLAPINENYKGRKRRLKWFFGNISLNGKKINVGGWNIPLKQPTGLTNSGFISLGRLLRRYL